MYAVGRRSPRDGQTSGGVTDWLGVDVESVYGEDWTPTVKVLPPNGMVVEAMDSGGHVQKLIREGNLWWFRDRSMYVYFVPQMWRALP